MTLTIMRSTARCIRVSGSCFVSEALQAEVVDEATASQSICCRRHGPRLALDVSQDDVEDVAAQVPEMELVWYEAIVASLQASQAGIETGQSSRMHLDAKHCCM